MFTALIAEDESKICQLILKLADWDSLGICVIGSCSDGGSALEAIEKERPDIVVTDIRMPVMSGLDIIEKVREREIPTEFIIISGYRQFDYAQTAMKYGVSEYLLKPIDKNELEAALKRSVEKCLSVDITQPTGDRKMWKIRQDLRNSFWERLLDSNSSIKLDEELLNSQYHLKFRNSEMFRIFEMVFYGKRDERFEETVSILVEDVRSVIDPECFEAVPFVKNRNQIYVMLNYPEDMDVNGMLKKVYSVISSGLKKYGFDPQKFILGVSSPEKGIQKIRQQIEEVKYAALGGMIQNRKEPYFYETGKFGPLTPETALTAETRTEMRTAADVLNAQLFISLMKSALYKVTPDSNPEIAFYLGHASAMIISNAAKNAGYSYETETGINHMLDEAAVSESYDGFVEHISLWVQKQFDSCLSQRKEFGSRPVHNARKYIENHYMDQITLESIADVVHLNPSYFSIIFKRETGKTFSDFLAEFRLEEAKRILRESSIPVAEVSVMVGYTDTKYFSRRFTKYVGVNPSAYRVMWG